jgi:hypothetical protein
MDSQTDLQDKFMAAQTGRCLCGSVRFRAEDVREHFTA